MLSRPLDKEKSSQWFRDPWVQSPARILAPFHSHNAVKRIQFPRIKSPALIIWQSIRYPRVFDKLRLQSSKNIILWKWYRNASAISKHIGQNAHSRLGRKQARI